MAAWVWSLLAFPQPGDKLWPWPIYSEGMANSELAALELCKDMGQSLVEYALDVRGAQPMALLKGPGFCTHTGSGQSFSWRALLCTTVHRSYRKARSSV